MTALVSAFSRAYHSTQNSEKIFDDYLAKKLLTLDEYEQISTNMSKGIDFFNPSFMGSTEEALRWIVDHQLSPTPLGRAVFAEKSLEAAVKIGTKQYLIFAAGYDTFAYRQPDWASTIQIFELDYPTTSTDKQKRIQSFTQKMPGNIHYISADFTKNNWQDNLITYAKFDQNKISFCSLLGISYYLSEEAFTKLIHFISSIVPKGSSIVFDYPDEHTYTENASERCKKQVMMTTAASEEMLASYSYSKLDQLLSACEFLIYEHLTPDEITKQYFEKYNQANPQNKMTAFDHVCYCLAVKK